MKHYEHRKNWNGSTHKIILNHLLNAQQCLTDAFQPLAFFSVGNYEHSTSQLVNSTMQKNNLIQREKPISSLATETRQKRNFLTLWLSPPWDSPFKTVSWPCGSFHYVSEQNVGLTNYDQGLINNGATFFSNSYQKSYCFPVTMLLPLLTIKCAVTWLKKSHQKIVKHLLKFTLYIFFSVHQLV